MPSLTEYPRPPETLAIDAILATLRDDPDLLAYGVTVWGPEGDRDQLPRFQPNAADLPLIRLIDGDYPAKWQDNISHQGTLRVHAELFSPGHDHAARFALFRLFVGAIFPEDDGRADLVSARFGGVASWTQRNLVQGGAQKVTIGADDRATRATATLNLLIDIMTQRG